MFFDNYKQHTDAQIRQSLFWEYDMSRFDWEKMRTLNCILQASEAPK